MTIYRKIHSGSALLINGNFYDAIHNLHRNAAKDFSTPVYRYLIYLLELTLRDL